MGNTRFREATISSMSDRVMRELRSVSERACRKSLRSAFALIAENSAREIPNVDSNVHVLFRPIQSSARLCRQYLGDLDSAACRHLRDDGEHQALIEPAGDRAERRLASIFQPGEQRLRIRGHLESAVA